MSHLEEHGILTDLQHGFRTGRSCETQLTLRLLTTRRAVKLTLPFYTFPKLSTQSHMTAYSVNSSTTALMIKFGHGFLIF